MTHSVKQHKQELVEQVSTEQLRNTLRHGDAGFGKLKCERHAKAIGRDFRKRDAPCKVCPSCGTVHANGTRICPECGHEHFAKVAKPSPFRGVKNEDRQRKGDKRYK